MNDYTHKKYLVRNIVTKQTRTVTKRIGSPNYKPPLQPYERVVACLGGFRNQMIEPCMFVDEMGANMAHYSKED